MKQKNKLTLNEAIKLYLKKANTCENQECANNNKQLAEWLKELKRFRKIVCDKLETYTNLRKDAIDFIERNITRKDEYADLKYKVSILNTAKDVASDADTKVKILDEILEYANENYESTHKISSVFSS